jgi:hypothetical protein
VSQPRHRHLETLTPARRLVAHWRDGQLYYVYADPETCKCLYVGTSAQYQLALEKHVANQQLVASSSTPPTTRRSSGASGRRGLGSERGKSTLWRSVGEPTGKRSRSGRVRIGTSTVRSRMPRPSCREWAALERSALDEEDTLAFCDLSSSVR